MLHVDSTSTISTMNKEQVELLKKIGERLGEIEQRLDAQDKKVTPELPKADVPAVVGQEIRPPMPEPECVISSVFQNDSPDAIRLNNEAQAILRKHLKEFCRSAKISELQVHFKEQ